VLVTPRPKLDLTQRFAQGTNHGVTVVIPTLNEQENIANVIGELKQIGFSDILIIDGNSKDMTAAIAKRLGVNVMFQNGHGKGNALRQVFSDGSFTGEILVMMDADGSMSPSELQLFVSALKTDVDVVKGSRFMYGGHSEDMTLVRRIGNLLFVKVTNVLAHAKYTDLCYGFAAFRRDAIERLYPNLRSSNFEIEAEIFIKGKKLGLNVVEVPSVELRRKSGKSNLKALRDGFLILKTILTGCLVPN
jgi:glycosyltransferase involved in cell wall biosynthesis